MLGGDYVASGSYESLQWIATEMRNRYECKLHLLEPDATDESQVKVSNRITSWHGNGRGSLLTYEAGPRHAEIIVHEFGLQDAKRLATFVVEIEIEETEVPLKETQATRYKSLVARANHLVADWPDLQYACREQSTVMAKPTEKCLEKLKRLGKYLKGKPRFVHRYPRLDGKRSLITYTDANFLWRQGLSQTYIRRLHSAGDTLYKIME